ncbi:hypothetical protein AGMMS4956_14490 [Bacteroidia bacterium]|nr:hypothetical protein AGMMS4956_14490 [Bacteroidia bacterium]
MKKIFTFLLAALCAASLAYGQVPPAWTQDAARNRNYPADEWYTGFVRDKLKAGANVGTALKTLEREAQNQLAESIIVKIEGGTEVSTTSTRAQAGTQSAERIDREYKQAVKTATSATTVKSEVQSWHDPATGYLYAFAATKRADLAAYYGKQVNLDLGAVEKFIKTAADLADIGKKANARKELDKATAKLDNVAYMQNLLTAVDGNVAEETLQQERSTDLYREVTKTRADMEETAVIYWQLRGEYADELSKKLENPLRKEGCIFIDDKAQADFVIGVSTTVRLRAKDANFEYYYLDADVTVTNTHDRKKRYDSITLSEYDGGVGSDARDKTVRKVIPVLAPKVIAELLPILKPAE